MDRPSSHSTEADVQLFLSPPLHPLSSFPCPMRLHFQDMAPSCQKSRDINGLYRYPWHGSCISIQCNWCWRLAPAPLGFSVVFYGGKEGVGWATLSLAPNPQRSLFSRTPPLYGTFFSQCNISATQASQAPSCGSVTEGIPSLWEGGS